MNAMKFHVSVCLSLIQLIAVLGQFQSQFVGSFVSKAEQSKRDFCGSKQCLVDAEILFLAASQNLSANPCNDFKEFSLGTFIKYRALNDRYQYRGLQTDLDDIFREKSRKILSDKNDVDDSRVIKVLKNYFANCVNSSE